MGRPRTYAPADLLTAAVRTFRRHGYAGTSIDALTRATGLQRGSLYAAYRGKRALFLAALEQYTNATVGHVERTLAAADDPVAGVAQTLGRVVRVAINGEGRHGCFIVNTAAELGGRDPEIQAAVAAALARLEAAFTGAIERAQAAGRVAADADPRALGRLCVAVMQGLRVLGSAGATEAELQQVVTAALGALPGRHT